MSLVTSELDERGVLTITLDDPERRNALSRGLTRELLDAFRQADADDSVRVVIVTNSGRVFCAGADLSERASGADDEGPGIDPTELFGHISASPKIFVGRIDGHCVAGGMGLAAAMDLSVVADDRTFGFTEVRVGVAPAMISVLCLPLMRHTDAAEAFLRGTKFDGRRAADLGLVTRAVPADELDETIDEMVSDLLLGAPGALAVTKQLLRRVPEMSATEAFRWTAEVSRERFRSPEAAEGVSAFLEHRSPSWARREPEG